MTAIFSEIIAILYMVVAYVLDVEYDGGEGPEKKAKVIQKVMKELKDEGGIQVSNKWALTGIEFALPILIDLAVKAANASGFFEKSS